MLHGFSKSMFHRKFHRALLGAKNCLGFSDIPKKSPAPQLALQLSQRSSASLLARLAMRRGSWCFMQSLTGWLR